MTCSPEIPPLIFLLAAGLFALGCFAGWLMHMAVGKPREVVVASPRGAKGRFVKRSQ